MTHRTRLRIASLTVASLWAGTLAWWVAPLQPAEVVTLAIGGMLAGVAWRWLHRCYFAWKIRPRHRAQLKFAR